ncbi:Phosphoribosyl 1,2-cyclic phosphodiesterase [Cnuella takakiae]|uniref:Phosphoribosyl 1,2-cyclic phosphodiesterase n=1 Tax=Cnuella takakiae TaxID=1302690 RepID=A0A1M5G357_9BACT|nr:MBL fold metallo-hydrolase [Cnuella takakiae]OLY92316.1 MBL fold metallo-hydrolase [Cnuella takakiae]SHF98153.1 Phosphoribosyl 1,2-cyclic phosphodiesterase [Cnuella takakiae]
MALSICSINSGSNGNCYYVGNDQEAILVDVGISCREVEQRMKARGLQMERVKAIFVSHEHTDHIRGIAVLAQKWRLPVYSTKPMRRRGSFWVDKELVFDFTAHQPVAIGGLTVTPFPKFHDAADPYSFTVKGNGVTVGVFTDLGKPCQQLVQHFSQCHAAFLESNYDEEMLDKGSYPYYLKHRIRGGNGHLSNREALQVFCNHRAPHLSHLLLAHLSKNNNCPHLVAGLFAPHAGSTHVEVASRFEASPVYTITASRTTLIRGTEPEAPAQQQLALF